MAEVKVTVPIFFKVTEGVTLAVVTVPLGVVIAEIPASKDETGMVYVKLELVASFVVLASVEPFGEAVLAVKVCAAAV